MYSIIPRKKEDGDQEVEWKPSMNLYELIQCIPDFITNHLAN